MHLKSISEGLMLKINTLVLLKILLAPSTQRHAIIIVKHFILLSNSRKHFRSVKHC